MGKTILTYSLAADLMAHLAGRECELYGGVHTLLPGVLGSVGPLAEPLPPSPDIPLFLEPVLVSGCSVLLVPGSFARLHVSFPRCEQCSVMAAALISAARPCKRTAVMYDRRSGEHGAYYKTLLPLLDVCTSHPHLQRSPLCYHYSHPPVCPPSLHCDSAP